MEGGKDRVSRMRRWMRKEGMQSRRGKEERKREEARIAKLQIL